MLEEEVDTSLTIAADKFFQLVTEDPENLKYNLCMAVMACGRGPRSPSPTSRSRATNTFATYSWLPATRSLPVLAVKNNCSFHNRSQYKIAQNNRSQYKIAQNNRSQYKIVAA